ncbi:MAG: c-type cytochrome [Anaerolineae bacterium]
MAAETTAGVTRTARRPVLVLQRIDRLAVIIAIIGLALTGLPQKFASASWAHGAFVLLGGIESARILHRFFALLLIAGAAFHVGAFLYRRIVTHERREAAGNAVAKALQQILINLGLRRADSTDYRFVLRLEYWVLVISVLLMIITGLVLWKPVVVTNVLPAVTIPLFLSLHGDHALALIVFLVVWRIGIAVLWRPKPLGVEPAADDSGISQRRRSFMPVALAVFGVLAVILGLYITSSQTAISTVLPRSEEVFAPQAIPEAGDANVGAALWQTLRCAFCHGEYAEGGSEGQPALRGTGLSFEAFYHQVRVASGDMPAFSAEELPDGYVLHLYTWLTQTMADATPEASPIEVTADATAEATAQSAAEPTQEPTEAATAVPPTEVPPTAAPATEAPTDRGPIATPTEEEA